MSDRTDTNVYADSIRELSEDYLRLARSIEEAVRPGGAGRPIDRLRRMAEASNGSASEMWVTDRIEGLCSDSIAGATSCYLRLVARMTAAAAEAARINDIIALTKFQIGTQRIATEVLEAIDRFEQHLDRGSDSE